MKVISEKTKSNPQIGLLSPKRNVSLEVSDSTIQLYSNSKGEEIKRDDLTKIKSSIDHQKSNESFKSYILKN